MMKNYQLSKRGEIEPYFDGLQSLKRYAKFWDGVEYDPELIKFDSTQTLRTGASIMAFSEGLFNGKGPLDTCKSQPIYYLTSPNSEFICPRWNETVLNNNKLLGEQIYAYGNKTLAPIAKRLSEEYGISPPLNPRLVPQIFNYCQFWLAVYNRTDDWYVPMNYYYHDIITIWSLIINIHMVILLMNEKGVLKDKIPLTADLTFKQSIDVKFTEDRLIHWSSTLYFKCSDDSVLIRVLLDFKPFWIPGCESEYCEWKNLKKFLGIRLGAILKGCASILK
ncbi:19296_t:CDS:2, partial [Funneliformis geosporum]